MSGFLLPARLRIVHTYQIEDERDALLDQVEQLKTERDQAAATSAERQAEIERLTTDLERERAASNAAQVDAAKSQLRLEAHAGALESLRSDVARLRDELTQSQAVRQAAEQAAAVAAAQLEAERQARAGADQRLADLAKVVERLAREDGWLDDAGFWIGPPDEA